jgi:hypothetical protein
MRLEPLYAARFTTPESWTVELRGPHGTEAQNLLFAQGRCEGRVTATLRLRRSRSPQLARGIALPSIPVDTLDRRQDSPPMA